MPAGGACPAATDGVASTDGDLALAQDQLALAALGFPRSFPLSSLPDPETIQVDVVDRAGAVQFEEGVDWSYAAPENAISLVEYVPERDSVVRVTYNAR